MHAVESGGCVDTVYKTITIQAKPVLNPTVTNVGCNGGNTGSITLNTTGGASPYTYAWADGANTANKSAIAEGTYAVTVTGSNGCVANYTTTLTRSSAVTLTETHNNITCNAANNANIDVTISGGAAPYFYHWNNGSISQNLTMVAAGAYTVTASDANNCSASVTINIIEPEKLQAALMVVNPVCAGTNNGTIDVNVSGGTPPMTYRWTNGSNAQSRTNLGAGTYAVMVNDANGCTATQSADITEPNEIVIKESHVNPTCNGYANGSIDITATGGSGNFTYSWNNQQTANTATNLTAGQYAVTVTDAKGCTSVLDHIIITHPAALVVDANITNAACGITNGGAIDVTVSGGNSPYQYNWSNSATTEDITAVRGGSYMLTVTDANGCIKVSNQTVQSSGSLVVTAVANQLPCEIEKGFINLSVSNGMAPYSFEWSNGETTKDIANVLPGTYNVTIKDAANCTFDTVLTIVNTNEFEVKAAGGGVTVAGQSAELSATTNGSELVTYNWTPTASLPCTACDHVVVRPTETTTYTVVATDTNGCAAHDTVTIEIDNENNIFIPNAFTPNGDGNNDVLQIYGNLNSIKYLQLLVFDRWGEKIYETNDVNFQWDGVYKGKKLDSGVYLYVMKVVHFDGTTNRTFKGSITLL
jgi:gliding motility-associated-like protein